MTAKLRLLLSCFVMSFSVCLKQTSTTTSPENSIIVNKIKLHSHQLGLQEEKTPPKGKQRDETSLAQLTRKFISLLQNSSDGILNLKEAVNVLQVKKRRVYDIINVLEGVGLLQRKCKNHVQWCDGSINAHEPVLSFSHFPKAFIAKKIKLEMENASLEAKECELNELIDLANNEVLAIHDNMDNRKFAFVTYRDILSLEEFSDQTLLAIKAPSGTRLVLPDRRNSIQIWLKCERGEIEVYLCSEDDGNRIESDDGTGESYYSDSITNENNQDNNCQKTEETALKFPFISEEDDLGPIGRESFLMQTEDQLEFSNQTKYVLSSNHSFTNLEPSLSEEDYNIISEEIESNIVQIEF